MPWGAAPTGEIPAVVTPVAPESLPARATALVVEDEAPLARMLAGYLEHEGFRTVVTGDGVAAVDLARQHAPTVVVLDLGLPGLDGVEVCRRIRTFSDCYILMLTARSEELDEVIGLSVGADDYIAKPFSPRTLMARIRTLLRRPRGGAAGDACAELPRPVIQTGPLRIDPVAREVRLDERPIPLTRTEFDLLHHLAAHPRQVFTREQLLAAVWASSWRGDDLVVDAHIGHLRRKLGESAATARIIQTVRGVGYRLGPG